jgi:cell division initiation protein
MNLTPQDVEKQVFRERRKGYDPEEVDQFLDKVAESLGTLARERDEANRRIGELEEASQGARESETLLRRTLISAERTAEQTVADAQEEAARMLEEARREAAELIETAEADSHEMRRAAEEEAAERRRAAEEETTQELEAARVGADRVRRAVAELQEFREEYRERVQAVIAEQLAALDRVGEMPELDPKVTELAKLRADGSMDQSSWS